MAFLAPLFFAALATFAVRAVSCGRRLARMERPRDVLSERAQRLHGFTVQSLPISTRVPRENLYAKPHGQQMQDAYEERLKDNLVTPIPDQVQFRVDFPAWLKTLTGRERRLIKAEQPLCTAPPVGSRIKPLNPILHICTYELLVCPKVAIERIDQRVEITI